jgi:hypothetical protein
MHRLSANEVLRSNPSPADAATRRLGRQLVGASPIIRKPDVMFVSILPRVPDVPMTIVRAVGRLGAAVVRSK